MKPSARVRPMSLSIVCTSWIATAVLATPPGTIVDPWRSRVIPGAGGPFTSIAASASNGMAASAIDGASWRIVRWGELDDSFGADLTFDMPPIQLAAGNGGSFAVLLEDGSAVVSTNNRASSFPGPFIDIACTSASAAAISQSGGLTWIDGNPPIGAPRGGPCVDLDLGLTSSGAVVRADGSIVAWGSALAGVPAPRGSFTAVSVGFNHAIGLSSTGEAVCWGDPSYGKCDAPPGPFIAVAAGWHHSIGLRPDGTIAQWGATHQPPPTGAFVAVDAGNGFSLALGADGSIVGWGRSAHGAHVAPGDAFVRYATVGSGWFALRVDGSIEQFTTASGPILPFTGEAGLYTDLTASSTVLAAITAEGDIVTSGVGAFGEDFAPEGTFASIHAGLFHFAALSDDGEISAWGLNAWGQCDAPAGAFQDLACGDYHTLALTDDGSVVAFGDNFFGQCDVPPDSFIDIAAGSGHSVGITAEGYLVAWGRNTEGQCDVSGGPYTSVNAAGTATAAVSADGTITCFGDGTAAFCAFMPAIVWSFVDGLVPITTGPDCDDDGVPNFAAIFNGAPDLDRNGMPDSYNAIGDLNGDGVVGASDLAILLGMWTGSGIADLDGDGVVGPADLALLIGAWSAETPVSANRGAPLWRLRARPQLLPCLPHRHG